jgi:hypothetical protein
MESLQWSPSRQLCDQPLSFGDLLCGPAKVAQLLRARILPRLMQGMATIPRLKPGETLPLSAALQSRHRLNKNASLNVAYSTLHFTSHPTQRIVSPAPRASRATSNMGRVFAWVEILHEWLHWYIYMGGIFVWVACLHGWYICVGGIFTWVVYLCGWHFYMGGVFMWVAYLHGWYICVGGIFTWVVYLQG